jgi:hypothetical protein
VLLTVALIAHLCITRNVNFVQVFLQRLQATNGRIIRLTKASNAVDPRDPVRRRAKPCSHNTLLSSRLSHVKRFLVVSPDCNHIPLLLITAAAKDRTWLLQLQLS